MILQIQAAQACYSPAHQVHGIHPIPLCPVLIQAHGVTVVLHLHLPLALWVHGHQTPQVFHLPPTTKGIITVCNQALVLLVATLHLVPLTLLIHLLAGLVA